MFIKELKDNEISVAIPLTKGKDKTRIKKRANVNEYGVPTSTRSEPFTENSYIEWQIGYDVTISEQDKLAKTTLKDLRFIGANGKEKALYELSEYIKYFYDWNIISKQTLNNIKNYLQSLNEDNFIDNPLAHPELSINRTSFVNKQINGLDFMYSKVEYPLLVYKFSDYDIITEIIIKEKQYAIGIQPMLYLCFPITVLENSYELIGRTANQKELGTFKINKQNIYIFLDILKIFGTLSKNHNTDVISIIDTIIK